MKYVFCSYVFILSRVGGNEDDWFHGYGQVVMKIKTPFFDPMKASRFIEKEVQVQNPTMVCQGVTVMFFTDVDESVYNDCFDEELGKMFIHKKDKN